jgi:hypothetical protein
MPAALHSSEAFADDRRAIKATNTTRCGPRDRRESMHAVVACRGQSLWQSPRSIPNARPAGIS